MTAQQQQYIARANQRLQEPLELGERIKLLRVVAQLYTQEANTLEDRLVDIAG